MATGWVGQSEWKSPIVEKRHGGGRQAPPPADNKKSIEKKKDGIFHSSLRTGISSAIVAKKNLDLCILYIQLVRNPEENWMNLVSPASQASNRC